MTYDHNSLVEQLEHDGVAFATENPNNWGLEESLLNVMNEIASREFPEIGVVVLEDTSGSTAQLRDLAQDMNLETGIDTVLVRTPNAVASVSDSLTRAELETAQRSLMAEPDYAAGLRAYADSITGFDIPWAVLTIAGLMAIAVVIFATAYFVKRDDLTVT